MNKILRCITLGLRIFNKRRERKIENNLPSSYHPAKEFIEDKEMIKALITCSFHLSAIIKNISFSYKDYVVTTDQKGSDFILMIEKVISKRLFYTSSKNHVAENFILGYINEIIPVLNEYLIKQKYLCGHLLIRTYSLLDIHELIIVNKDNGESFNLSWPIAYTNFPRSLEFAEESNYKFIRDLIEATTFYFYNNLDDCIRKIISSAENFFKLRKINGKYFKVKLLNCLTNENYVKQWEQYLTMFYSNLMYIYKVRNNIVHDKYRMDFNDSWLCKKGIGTLFYLYQNRLNDTNTLKYNFSLMTHFVALDNLCMGLKLDMMRDLSNRTDRPFINTSSDIDKFIFSGLEISREEMEEIDRKLKSYTI